MNTIGLLGGMSWESTLSYYRHINQGVKSALGGLHSAQLVLYSVDFDAIEKMQHQGDWTGTAEVLADAAKRIESAGADFLLICTNTMHKVAPLVASEISIPLIHIADATGAQIQAQGFTRVGLLGTAFTMEEDFYKGRLSEQFGLQVLIPESEDRQHVHRIIYDELCQGKIAEDSRQHYIRIVRQLQSQGAQAIILGCTEISLLLGQSDSPLPLFDTTAIHAQKAVELAIATDPKP